MEERRRLVRGLELGFEFVFPIPDCDQLVLHVSPADPFDDRLNDLLPPRLELNELTLRGRLAGALLHAKPVHLLRELAAELLEEVLAHQFVLKRTEHAFLDFRSRNRQLVGTRPTATRTEASELLTRVDNEPGTTFAALRET